MQVTKGTWRMRKQCVPGSLSSSPAQEPGNEARYQVCNYNTATSLVAGCLSSAHSLLFVQSPPEAVSVSPVVQSSSPVQ